MRKCYLAAQQNMKAGVIVRLLVSMNMKPIHNGQ